MTGTLLMNLFIAMTAVSINKISSNAGISACEKAAQWEVASIVLREKPQMRLLPNEINFNASISACEKAAQWKVALSLLW